MNPSLILELALIQTPTIMKNDYEPSKKRSRPKLVLRKKQLGKFTDIGPHRLGFTIEPFLTNSKSCSLMGFWSNTKMLLA